MIGPSRLANFTCILTFCFLFFAILLALTWPSPATAQPQAPPDSPDGPSPTETRPASGPDSAPPTTPGPTPAPTSTPRPGNGSDGLPGDPTGGGSNGLPGDPTSKTTLEKALAEHELIKALAPNRIIFHAATPIQLCKVDEGLQIYYVGRDGKTRLGPWIPSFAELAAKYPEGDEASLYLGSNPLTGKRVKIDYLPHVKRIRVDTFYADRENDINKQYIFHFGPEHDITYDVW